MRLAAAGPLGAGALVIGYGLGWPPAVAAAGASVTVAGVVAAVLQPGLGTPGDS